jgi:DNA-binding transcriptional MocR family regulator
VLAPHAVREKLVLAAEAAVLCPPTFNQLVVAEYLATQDWQGQVVAFRSMYRERRDAMLDALAQQMPPGTTWTRPSGGFYVWVTLPGELDAKVLLPRAVTARVAFVPGTAFFADGTGSRTCACRTATPSRTASARGCAACRPSSRRRSSCAAPSDRPVPPGHGRAGPGARARPGLRTTR